MKTRAELEKEPPQKSLAARVAGKNVPEASADAQFEIQRMCPKETQVGVLEKRLPVAVWVHREETATCSLCGGRSRVLLDRPIVLRDGTTGGTLVRNGYVGQIGICSAMGRLIE